MAGSSLAMLMQRVQSLAGATGHDDWPDARLLQEFVEHRSQAAFASIVQRHGPLVWRVCRRVLGNQDGAEDAFQAAFLVLASKARSIRKTHALASWLHGVAFRVASQVRAQSARKKPEESRLHPAADPGQQAALNEVARIIEEEVHALPEKLRLPILLCYSEGKTNEEAAGVLGWACGTVKTRLAKARAVLHEHLLARGVSLPAGVIAVMLAEGGAEGAVPIVAAVSTIKAAAEIAAGKSLATASSARIAALAEHVLTGLASHAWRLTVLLALALSIAAVGGGAWLCLATAETPAQPPAAIVPAMQAPPVAPAPGGLPAGAALRLGSTRFRHDGEAGSVIFSPNGKLLAAQSGNGTILVWDARTGEAVQQLPGFRNSVVLGGCIAFTPDSKTLMGRQDAAHIALWDVTTGKQLRQILLPDSAKADDPFQDIHTLRLSADGKWLAITGSSNRNYLVDAATGKVLRAIKENIGGLAFSPDGKVLAMQIIRLFEPRGNDLQLRSTLTGEVLQSWPVPVRGKRREGAEELICDIAFSDDGKLLAAAGTDRILLWDIATGMMRQPIEAKMGQVMNLAFTPNRQTLLSAHDDGKIRSWEVATGKELRHMEARVSVVRSMALSPGGKTVAAGGVHNTIRLWDVATGGELFADDQGHDAQVNSVAYAPDGKLLATAGENRRVCIWDAASGKLLRQFTETSATQATFSPNGRRLALLSPGKAYSPKLIHVLDAETGKEMFRIAARADETFSALAFAPDGKTLLSTGWTRSQRPIEGDLKVWDAETGQHLQRFGLPGFRPDCLAVSGDGQLAALGGTTGEGAIQIWDLQRGKKILSMTGHAHVVSGVAFAPDGRTLLSGSQDGTARLWEVATGKRIFTFPVGGANGVAVACSQDGRLLAAAAATARGGKDRPIRLWDAATGAEVQQMDDRRSGVTSLCFAPGSARLASGLVNSTILLWDTAPAKTAKPASRVLGPQEIASSWADLGNSDARKAHAAITVLAANPETAIPFLQTRLGAVPQPDAQRIKTLIADLDSPEFTRRDLATKELQQLAERATAALRLALQQPGPSLETRRRLEALLAEAESPPSAPASLQALRAVAVLERIATPPATKLLNDLAGGADEARLTRQAKASLNRLKNRP